MCSPSRGASELDLLRRQTLAMEAMAKRSRGGESDSDESSDGGSPAGLGQASKSLAVAARIRRKLAKHPERGFAAIEAAMVKSTNGPHLHTATPLEYVNNRMLLSGKRTEAYLATHLAAIHGALIDGNTDQARFLTAATIMAMDQALLDQGWNTASRLSGLEPPAWPSWAGQDGAQLRRQSARSRLLPHAWYSGVIAEIRDDETAMKYRAAHQDHHGFSKGDGKHGGAGGGGKPPP